MVNTGKSILTLATGVLSLAAMLFTFGSTGRAQCYGTADQWLAAVATYKEAPRQAQVKTADPKVVSSIVPEGEDDNKGADIVGLWHVHYLGPFPPTGDLEAFQIFNAGGTEVHNPNIPSNGVCLGAWVRMGRRSYKLTHRVWLFTPEGNFVGHLNADIMLNAAGNLQTGTLTMQLFDLQGNAVSPLLPGTLNGERVSPN